MDIKPLTAQPSSRTQPRVFTACAGLRKDKSAINYFTPSFSLLKRDKFNTEHMFDYEKKINLEEMIKRSDWYDEVISLVKLKKYKEVFDKCKEWWALTANNLPLLSSNKSAILQQDKGRKVELLSIGAIQYLFYCYKLEDHFLTLTKKYNAPDNTTSISIASSLLSSSHQSFLSIINQLYNKTTITDNVQLLLNK
jgi:hypothetical protein